ncbi:MAG: hypothetical protein ACLT98_12230 [Eggerthellaceae bacterium]
MRVGLLGDGAQEHHRVREEQQDADEGEVERDHGIEIRNDADSVAVTTMGTATLSSDRAVSRLKESMSTLTSKKG